MHTGEAVTKAEARTALIEDRYRQAELLLERRVSACLGNLGQRLELVRRAHDVTWKLLIDAQRDIQDLADSDRDQPSIWSYWEEHAHPRSAPLFEAASAAIAEETALIADAVTRFCQTSRRLGSVSNGVMQHSVGRVLGSLATASMSSTEINELGQRWQKRLRRAAVRRAALSILTSETSRSDQLVVKAEMELLDSAPWAHMDRLLMAFEFAHSDVRTHLQDSISDLIERSCDLDDDSVIARELSRKLQTSL